MKHLLVFCFLCISAALYGQQTGAGKQLVQVSGIIHDTDSNTVVPYVTITNRSAAQSFAANYQGYFSFIAKPGDSLVFRAVGYKERIEVVPASLTEDKYTLMVKLKPEIQIIQAVRIYPWATVEDFTRQFLSMKVADDDLEIAKKNLSASSIRRLSLGMPMDSQEIGSMNSRYEHDRALNKNMVQTNPLLNPFAWGRFIQSITNGDKTRDNNN